MIVESMTVSRIVVTPRILPMIFSESKDWIRCIVVLGVVASKLVAFIRKCIVNGFDDY